MALRAASRSAFLAMPFLEHPLAALAERGDRLLPEASRGATEIALISAVLHLAARCAANTAGRCCSAEPWSAA